MLITFPDIILLNHPDPSFCYSSLLLLPVSPSLFCACARILIGADIGKIVGKIYEKYDFEAKFKLLNNKRSYLIVKCNA